MSSIELCQKSYSLQTHLITHRHITFRKLKESTDLQHVARKLFRILHWTRMENTLCTSAEALSITSASIVFTLLKVFILLVSICVYLSCMVHVNAHRVLLLCNIFHGHCVILCILCFYLQTSVFIQGSGGCNSQPMRIFIKFL